ARPEALFMARYKNRFMGRWVRHASLYPTWITRLGRPDRVRLERQVHSVGVSDAPMGGLQAHLIHYRVNTGLGAWPEEHNRYSGVEAELAINRPVRPIDWSALWGRDPAARRRALKELSFRVPFRPTLRFLYMYILRRGFLDGWPGYVYCRLISHYEFMIVVKTEELRRRARGEGI